MNTQTALYQIMRRLLTCALASIALLLTSCGGGSGSDSSPHTIRPKSLDGLVFTLDTNVTFQFVRNAGTSAALLSGDEETGTFVYVRNGNQIRQYPNFGGDNSDTRYPDTLTGASYIYHAINESSAILTLNGTGVNDLVTNGGKMNALNGSFTFLFNTDSSGNIVHQVVLDITFATNSSSISSNIATVRIPGSPEPQYDVIYVPSGIRMLTGGVVPENYNPVIDPLRPSLICPASLNNLIFNCTNGIPNPFFDFSVQFVTQAKNLNKSNATDPDETGQGLFRIAGSPVDNAINYTWRRVNGTDTGILVISGGNNTFDGKYTLSFTGQDSGSYVGEIDAGTLDAAEVSGSFLIPAGIP
jgi:hypothetical protein